MHIGQSDMGVEKARAILGKEKIIGVTAKTVEQAKAAEAAGADYTLPTLPQPTQEAQFLPANGRRRSHGNQLYTVQEKSPRIP